MIPVAPSGQKYARLAILAGLDAYGVTVPVSTQLPATPPERFIVVSRTGGVSPDFAGDEVRLLAECYAVSEIAAEELALTAQAGLRWVRGRVIDGRVLGWRDDFGPTRFDNPDTEKRFRFQFTGALRVSL